MVRKKQSAENTVKNIRRRARRKYNAEEKIRIVIEGLRGDLSVAELCRREGITQSLYYKMEGVASNAKNFWKRVKRDCPATASVRQTATKWPNCAKKAASSNCWSQNFHSRIGS